MVGQDVAVGPDDDAGAEAALTPLRHLPAAPALPELIAEELAQSSSGMSWLTLRTRRSERIVTTAGVTCSTTPAYERGRERGRRRRAAAAATGAAEAVGPKPSEALHPMTEPGQQQRDGGGGRPPARPRRRPRGSEMSV